MKTNTGSSAQTLENLLNDLRTLVSEAEEMMGDSAGEPGGETVDALRARFNAAQERFADLYADAKERVVAGAKCTDAAIRANPYQSIAIAAGIGLLVGVLVGRRSQS